MTKRVVFEFDERSEIPLDKLRAMGFRFIECCGYVIPDLKPVDPEAPVAYESAMGEAIPQIIHDVQERGRLADEVRTRRLT